MKHKQKSVGFSIHEDAKRALRYQTAAQKQLGVLVDTQGISGDSPDEVILILIEKVAELESRVVKLEPTIGANLLGRT